MATIIGLQEQAPEFPEPTSLDEFRRWAQSDDFPEHGRIDYIGGRLEVDMSPEMAFSHGVLKPEISGVLRARIKRLRLGKLFSDRMRLSCPAAGLSVEPDVLFISDESLAAGRVRLIASVVDEHDFVELEGAADLIVEIVSNRSVGKDTRMLPAAYYHAGSSEFWLIDARGDELVFVIHCRGEGGFEPVIVDDEAFQFSEVMGCRYRLERRRDQSGHWDYDLQEREAN